IAVTPESERDPEDNPDNDELNNALEYLTGSNPEESAPSPLQFFRSGDSLVVTFPRTKAIPMNTEQIEVSGDLMEWDPAPDGVASSSDLNELQSLIIVTLPFEGLTQQFMQIAVDVSGQ
ncbi:MAG: hypothetical protein GWQ05_12315, partial [Verrucomicrobiaceae bacterium]|nr:hypothetical protein [Verrucomicrobiaceae bacterium]